MWYHISHTDISSFYRTKQFIILSLTLIWNMHVTFLGQVQSKTFDLIQRAQNKALRIISFKNFMEPSE